MLLSEKPISLVTPIDEREDSNFADIIFDDVFEESFEAVALIILKE